MFEVKKITKIYKNKKGIKDISFQVKKGTICGLIGNNGAGKTTLINAIFDEYKKDSGTVFCDNQEIYHSDVISKISLFPDKNIFPNTINLLDFLTYIAMLGDLNYRKATQKAKRTLELVYLSEYHDKKFSNLSAGMQKRALLAISLINNPEVIIFDEPTANLDVKTRIQFLEVLKSLKKMDKTIIISSHLIDELEDLIDQIIVIENGELILDIQINKKTDLKKIYKKLTCQEQVIDLEKIERLEKE